MLFNQWFPSVKIIPVRDCRGVHADLIGRLPWPNLILIRFLGYDPSPPPESLGQSLKRYRQVRGMPQRELAKVLGVDPGTLGR